MVFKKQKQPDPKSQSQIPFQVKVTQRYDQAKQKLAAYLQTQSERLSLRMRKILLLTAGFIIAGISIGSIINAFATKNGMDYFNAGSLEVPHVDSTAPVNEPLISQEDYQRIMGFKRSLDSLKSTEKGKTFYDSLRKHRHGLFDSLNKVLQLNHIHF